MSYIHKNEFIEYAENLNLGDSGYFPHEGCTPNNKMWVKNTPAAYISFCNKCGGKGYHKKGIQHVSKLKLKDKKEIYSTKDCVELPDDISYDISTWPKEAKLWLYGADIRNFQIKKYGICYSKDLHRVIIPVYNENEELITWQGRGLLPEQTKYLNLKNEKKNASFFKSWVSKEKIHKYNKDVVVLVEDALSVIKVGRIVPCVTALGTSLSIAQLNFLGEFDKVLVWLDGDKGGLEGSKKTIKRLSLLTDVQRIRTEKDPKKYSYKEIMGIINSAL